MNLGPTRLLIDGDYRDAHDGTTFADYSPIDGAHLAEVAAGTAEDVDLAVTTARRAYDAGVWSRASPATRKRVLLRYAELVDEHAGELARIVTLETGKAITSARAEAGHSASALAYYRDSRQDFRRGRSDSGGRAHAGHPRPARRGSGPSLRGTIR